MIEKIPIDDTREGNCCPVCNSTRITRHEQRNLQVSVNLSTEKPFYMKNGRMKHLSKTSLTEAAAGPTNVVNAAGKVVFLQSKVNEEKENGTERIRIYKRNVRTQ